MKRGEKLTPANMIARMKRLPRRQKGVRPMEGNYRTIVRPRQPTGINTT
jgi:hypothetical protein